MLHLLVFLRFFYVILSSQITLNLVELLPEQKGISLSTNYELKVLLEVNNQCIIKRSLNSTSRISLNFSGSDITIQDGALATCLNLDIFNENNQTIYQNCSCQTKFCTIITTNNLAQGVFFWLRFGVINNPTFVNDEQILLRMDYAGSSDYSIYPMLISSDVYQAGLMSLISLTQSSFKVNAVNDLCMNLTTAHSVDPNGNLRITFPVQVSFLQNITVKVLVNGTNMTGTISITIPNSQILISQLFTSQVTQFTLYILATLNPQSIQISNSFTIESLTSQLYLVDSIQSQVVVQVNFPETIKINYVGVYPGQSSIVATNTVFYFSIQPAVSFPGGGHLEIEFPPQISITSTTRCNKILGLAIYQGSTYNCTSAGQIVSTMNLQYPSGNSQLLMMVLGVITPNSTKPTTTFKFRTYDNGGNLICLSTQTATFTATSNLITVSQMVRSYQVVGQPTQLSFTFQSITPISKGYFLLRLPNYQSIPDPNNPLLCSLNGTMTSCVVQDSTTTLPIPNINGWVRIRAPLASSTLSFVLVQGFLNPPFIPTTQGIISIQTYTQDDWLVDESSITSTIQPPISPIMMPFYSLARLLTPTDAIMTTSSLPVNTPVVLEVDIPSPSSYFNAMDGNLILNLNSPNYAAALGQQIQCSVQNATQWLNRVCSITSYYMLTPEYPHLNLTQQLQIQALCGGPNQTFCVNKTDFNVMISGLKTTLAGGTYNYSSIQAQITTLDALIISSGQQTTGTIQFINQPQTTSNITYSVQSQVTGITTMLSLDFTSPLPLDVVDRGGSFQIIGVPTQTNSTCLASVNSIFLMCSCQPQLIVIQQSGLDPNTFAGAVIALQIAQVQNPPSLKASQPLTILQYYNFTQVSSSGQVSIQVTQPRLLQTNITRTQSQLGRPTSIFIQYLVENIISDRSYIVEVGLPMEQMQLTQLQVFDAAQNLIPSQLTNTSTQYVIQFRKDDCPCQQIQVNMTLMGFANVATSRIFTPNTYLSLKTLDNYVYQTSQSITINPALSTGSISLLSSTQTAQQVNQPTQISLTLNLSTILVNCSLILQFSQPLFASYQPQVSVNGKLTSSLVSADTISYQYLYANNSQITVLISHLNTTAYLVDRPYLQLNITTMTIDNFVLDSGTFDVTTLLQLRARPITLVLQAPQFGYTLSPAQMNVSFNAPTQMPLQTQINISIPYLSVDASTTSVRGASLANQNNGGCVLSYSTSQVFNQGDVVTIQLNSIILPRYAYPLTNAITLQIMSGQQTSVSYLAWSVMPTQMLASPINTTTFVSGGAGQISTWQLQIQLPFAASSGDRLLIQMPYHVFPSTLVTECPTTTNMQTQSGAYVDTITLLTSNSSIYLLCLVNPFVVVSQLDVYLMQGQLTAAHGLTNFTYTPTLTNFSSIVLTRTVTFVGQATSLQIQIPTINIIIPAQSQISLAIPATQILTSSNFQCYQDNTQIPCSASQQVLVITPINLCPSQQTPFCRQGGLNFTILNLMNPPNISNVSGGVTTNIGIILQSNGGLILPPLSIPPPQALTPPNTQVFSFVVSFVGPLYTQSTTQLVLSFPSPCNLKSSQTLQIDVPYLSITGSTQGSVTQLTGGGFSLTWPLTQVYSTGDMVTIQIQSVVLPRYVTQFTTPISMKFMDALMAQQYEGTTQIPIQVKPSNITTVMQVNSNSGAPSIWLLQVQLPFDPMATELLVVRFPPQVYPKTLEGECAPTNNQTTQGDYVDSLTFQPSARYQTYQLCVINPFTSASQLNIQLLRNSMIAAQGLITFQYTPIGSNSTGSIHYTRSNPLYAQPTSLLIAIQINNATIIPAYTQITLVIPDWQFTLPQNLKCYQNTQLITCVQQTQNQIQLTPSNLCPLQSSSFCRLSSINFTILNLINAAPALNPIMKDITTNIGDIIRFMVGIAVPSLTSIQTSTGNTSTSSGLSGNTTNTTEIRLSMKGPLQANTLSIQDLDLQFTSPIQIVPSDVVVIQVPQLFHNQSTLDPHQTFTNEYSDGGFTLTILNLGLYNPGDQVSIRLQSLIFPRYVVELLNPIVLQIRKNGSIVAQGQTKIGVEVVASNINSLMFVTGQQWSGQETVWQLQVELPFMPMVGETLVIGFPFGVFPNRSSQSYVQQITVTPTQRYQTFNLSLVNPFTQVSNLSLLYLNGDQQEAAQGVTDFSYLPQMFNSLMQTTMSRSSTLVDNPTNLQILLPMDNVCLPARTKITIKIPPSQFLFNPSNNMTCYLNDKLMNQSTTTNNNTLYILSLSLCPQDGVPLCTFKSINITILDLVNPSQVYQLEDIVGIDVQMGTIIQFQNGIAFPLLTNQHLATTIKAEDSSSHSPTFGPASILTILVMVGLAIYLIASMIKLPYQPFVPALVMTGIVVVSISRTIQLVIALVYGVVVQQTFGVFLQASVFCLCVLQPYLHLSGTFQRESTIQLLTGGQMERIGLAKLFGQGRLNLSPQHRTNYLAVRRLTTRMPQLCLSALLDLIGIVVFATHTSEEVYLFGFSLLNHLIMLGLHVTEKVMMPLTQ